MSQLLRQLLRTLEIRPGEGRMVGLLSCHAALGLAITVLLNSALTALFLEAYDTALLPWLFSLQALAFIAASTLQSSLASRLSRKTEVGGTLLLFILMVLATRLLLPVTGDWLIFAACVLLAAMVEVVAVQSWLVTTGVFDARQGKRLIPVVSAGGTLGAVAGGFFAGGLAGWLGAENIIALCTPLLLTMLLLGLRVFDRYLPEATAEPETAPRAGAADSKAKTVWSEIRSDRLLRGLMLVITVAGLASTLLDFQFKTILKATYDKNQIAAFLGVSYAVLNAAVFLFQLLLTGRVLIRFGLSAGLVLLPLALLFGSLGFIAAPLLASITLTRFSESLFKWGTHWAATGLALVPFPPLQQTRLKIFKSGILKPASVFLASGFLILLGQAADLRLVAAVVAGLGALGIWAALSTRRPYLERLGQSLSDRRVRLRYAPELARLADRELLQLFGMRLDSDDRATVLAGLELVEELAVPIPNAQLAKLCRHPDRGIRHQALHTLRQAGDSAERQRLLLELLEQYQEPAEKASCLKSLRRTSHPATLTAALAHAGTTDPALHGEALTAILSLADASLAAGALTELSSLATGSDPEQTILAAYIIGESGRSDLATLLEPLLQAPLARVRREALRAAGKLKAPQLLPKLADGLADAALHRDAMAALVGFGAAALPCLEAVHRAADDLNLRRRILKTLGRIAVPQARHFCLEQLQSKQPRERQAALSALDSQALKMPPVSEERPLLFSCIATEAAWGYRLHQAAQLLSESFPEPPGAMERLLLDEICHGWQLSCENLFRAFGLLYDRRTVYQAYINFTSGDRTHQANALELLDNLLDKRLALIALPLLEGTSPPRGAATILQQLGAPNELPTSQEQALLNWSGTWLAAVAAAATGWGPSHPLTRDIMQTIERICFLKSVPLFAELPAEELQPVAELFREVHFSAGASIFRQNDPGDAFYLVMSGQVRVERDGREVASLERGSYFGEMALLDYEPRSASLIATSDCELFELGRDAFFELLEEHPELAGGIIRTLAQRLRKVLAEQ